jgi:hypothetical protein
MAIEKSVDFCVAVYQHEKVVLVLVGVLPFFAAKLDGLLRKKVAVFLRKMID